MANINQTLQQRLGFNDPDLTSPAHDELVLWIGDNIRAYIDSHTKHNPLKNLDKYQAQAKEAIQHRIKELVDSIRDAEEDLRNLPDPEKDHLPGQGGFQYRGTYLKQRCEEYAGQLNRIRSLTEKEPPPIPAIRIKTTFEVPVNTDRNQIVGFTDVVAQVDLPYLYLSGIQTDDHDKNPRLQHDKELALDFTYNQRIYAFEAKPRIRSLGELLRQLRTYKQYDLGLGQGHRYHGVDHWIVVSPDVRYRQTIIDQGFGFWESPLSL